MTDHTVPDETDDSDRNEPTDDSTAETDGALGTIAPALRPVVAFVVRFVWIVGRLLIVGGRIAIEYLTDRERRIGAGAGSCSKAIGGRLSAVSWRACSSWR